MCWAHENLELGKEVWAGVAAWGWLVCRWFVKPRVCIGSPRSKYRWRRERNNFQESIKIDWNITYFRCEFKKKTCFLLITLQMQSNPNDVYELYKKDPFYSNKIPYFYCYCFLVAYYLSVPGCTKCLTCIISCDSSTMLWKGTIIIPYL